jgi:two-component system, chemotaxis family, response regulator Rcp1
MPPEGTNKYILIAEDNAADVVLVREALTEQRLDWHLQVITDGEAAIEFIDQIDSDSQRLRPEVILLDLHLPKQDGEAILNHLRSSRRCGKIPVIVLTSSGYAGHKRNVERHPGVHYFRKPSSFLEFMEVGVVVSKALAMAATP